MNKPVILTGLRANNDLHIGNYLGALLPMVDMAKARAGEYQINLFVPDLHSITTPVNHDKLKQQIMTNVKAFVATGLPLDEDNIHIYRQSFVPAHSELTIILNNFTHFGELRRMTQFKDKVQRAKNALMHQLTHPEESLKTSAPTLELKLSEKELKILVDVVDKSDESIGSVGLFDYPVLMAADILLYGATYVPVGDDQSQHLEFTRDIAMRMNTEFGKLFVVPKPVKEQHEFFGKDQGLRIRDLQDPTKKMSKSDETGKGVIFLADSPEDAKKKIISATTDSVGEVQYDYDKQPGISNLLDILKLLGSNPDEFVGQKEYGPLKSAVANKVAEFLQDFQAKFAQVDENKVLAKLEASEKVMNEQANKTLTRVQKAVGLRP